MICGISLTLNTILNLSQPKPEIAKDIKTLRQANNVGKLDIVWRSNFGEKGRLQTSQLQRLVSLLLNYKVNPELMYITCSPLSTRTCVLK